MSCQCWLVLQLSWLWTWMKVLMRDLQLWAMKHHQRLYVYFKIVWLVNWLPWTLDGPPVPGPSAEWNMGRWYANLVSKSPPPLVCMFCGRRVSSHFKTEELVNKAIRRLVTYLRPLQFGAGGKKWLQSIYHHTNNLFTCFLYDEIGGKIIPTLASFFIASATFCLSSSDCRVLATSSCS